MKCRSFPPHLGLEHTTQINRKIPANGKQFLLIRGISVAPFNSLLEREKVQKINENPGPGTYAAEKVKIMHSTSDKAFNAFTTKIERFCPTAPGSSIYKPPTYIQNPGPGTHFNSLKFMGHASSTDDKRRIYG